MRLMITWYDGNMYRVDDLSIAGAENIQSRDVAGRVLPDVAKHLGVEIDDIASVVQVPRGLDYDKQSLNAQTASGSRPLIVLFA